MDAEYSLGDPFGIDDGELDGLTPQQCFVLGVEFHMLCGVLDLPEEINRVLHPENVDRIRAAAKRRNRPITVKAYDDSWFELRSDGTADGR